MREIKFRVWDRTLSKMRLWIEPKNTSDKRIILEIYPNGRWVWTYTGSYKVEVDCDNGILMQYTGLKDKNGVEIYEGDIVKHDFYWSDIEGFEMDRKIGSVDFRGGNFSIKETGLSLSFASDNEKCEVIGNIYENPELKEAK